MTEPETKRAVIAKLMSILSGDTPIEAGADLVAPTVVAHVDGWRFEGINVWANWIHYIRTRGALSEPTLVLDRIDINHDATVTVQGRWEGVRDGRRMTSKPCLARYRVAEGRIVEIWSTRRNYAFLCGRHVEYRLGFALELLRARRWKQQRGSPLDLTSHERPRQPSFAAPALGMMQ